MDARRHKLHVALSTGVYSRLRTESERSGQPTTVLVREAVEAWLAQREKETLHDAIVRYARSVAGTPADLDPEMESAIVQCFLDGERVKREET